MRIPAVDTLLKEVSDQILANAIFTNKADQADGLVEVTTYSFANGTNIYIYRNKETQVINAITTGDGDFYDFSDIEPKHVDVKLAETLVSIYSWDMVGK
jgi:hypothetical protein